jgi:hypothetical protein
MWFRLSEHNTLRPRENCVVLCSSLPSLSLSFFDRESVVHPPEEVSTRSFYSLRLGSYNETWGLTGDPEVVKTIYSI